MTGGEKELSYHDKEAKWWSWMVLSLQGSVAANVSIDAQEDGLVEI